MIARNALVVIHRQDRRDKDDNMDMDRLDSSYGLAIALLHHSDIQSLGHAIIDDPETIVDPPLTSTVVDHDDGRY